MKNAEERVLTNLYKHAIAGKKAYEVVIDGVLSHRLSACKETGMAEYWDMIYRGYVNKYHYFEGFESALTCVMGSLGYDNERRAIDASEVEADSETIKCETDYIKETFGK